MEVERDKMSVTVRYRGKNYTTEVPGDATVGLLGRQLSQLTGVELHTMRLLVPKGRGAPAAPLLPASEPHSSQSIKSSGISPGVVLRLMGATSKEILEVNQPVEDVRALGFQEVQRRPQPQPDTRMFRNVILPTGPSLFHKFRLLMFPFLELNPPADKARDIIFRLVRDPGIVAIMNKYKWRVGTLSELAPERLLGVSPKCVLGFNKNRGGEISLRFRTDDIQDFRKYSSIKKTLLHELAHMVHDEHNESFHALEKQLNQEAIYWTEDGGFPLSGQVRSAKAIEDENESTDFLRVANGYVPYSWTADSRNAAARAAMTRLTRIKQAESPLQASENKQASQKLNEQAGTKFDKMLVGAVDRLMQQATPTETAAAFETLSTILSYCLNYPNDRMYKVLSKGNPRFHNLVGRFEAAVEFLRVVGFSDVVVGGDNILVFPEADPGFLGLALSILDNAMALASVHPVSVDQDSNTSRGFSRARKEPGPEEFMHPEEPDPDEIGRIQDATFAARARLQRARLQRAIDSLMQQATRAEAIAAIKKLSLILSYRLNYSNASQYLLCVGHPEFHNLIGRFEAALEFLRVVGFSGEEVCGSYNLVLREADPGLLWIALSVLHNSKALK